MTAIDFDFQRYVELRKGAREAQAREGAGYAYGGDLRVLRTLDKLRPVRMALESAVRLWRSGARDEMLKKATRASPQKFPEVHAAAAKCAEMLHLVTPAVYVAPELAGTGGQVLGTEEDPVIVLDRDLVDGLSEPELVAVIGHACGHVQNNHAVFTTALYHLHNFANRFVKWIVAPAALALGSWARRAEITCDRANLLCTRDLDRSTAVLQNVWGTHPDVARRVEALKVFAESAYYKGMRGEEGGLNPEQCDARVAEIMSK